LGKKDFDFGKVEQIYLMLGDNTQI